MNILLVTYEYPPDHGGIASYLGGLFGLMSEVRVLKLAQPSWRFAWLLQIPKIFRAARTANLVFVSHLLPLGTAAMLVGRPYAVIVHGLDLRSARRKRFLASRVLQKAKLIVANSRATASELPPFGISAGHALILTPGIDASWHAEAAKSGSRGPQKTVLSVGRFVPRKGLGRLIRLLPTLRERCGDVRLVLAGAGPEEEELRLEAKKSGIESSVRFVVAPDQAALANEYRACDVFAFPVCESKDDVEGFGIVLLEAALFGKPVVASRTGGVSEAIEDGVTGFLTDPNSESDFLEKLIRVLNEPETAERLGSAGRERILREFQWKDRVTALQQKLA